jgi:outer membrane lipoprotein-sorting protein
MKKIVTIILVLCSLLFCSFGCEAASPFIETPELENKMNEYFAQIDQSEMLLER